jgi:hypothetical protein
LPSACPRARRDLAEQLPPEPAAWPATDGPAEPFWVDRYLRREEVDPGISGGEAEDLIGRAPVELHARAVFATLREAVGEREFLT